MLLPASTGSGESDLVSARLAEVLTVVSSVAVLSEVSGSNRSEERRVGKEWMVGREESTLNTRVTDLLAPLVIVVRFYPTTPAVRVPPPVAETKLVPAVIASGRLRHTALACELSADVCAYVLLLPASTGSGESDLVSARLAEVLTVVSSVAVLSEVSGSNTPEVVRSEEQTSVVQAQVTFAWRLTHE